MSIALQEMALMFSRNNLYNIVIEILTINGSPV